MNDILTVEETALFLHKHPVTIRHWILDKKLKARKISAGGTGVYVLLRNDILEYIVAESFKEKSVKPKKIKPLKNQPFQTELPI
jgi:hypothetical protein